MTDYQALIANQYTGLVQFKPISSPGTWLGDGNGEDLFPLTHVLTKWNIKRGGGGFNYGNQHDIYSNWVYGTVAGHQNMCWSAQNFGGSILKHWNWDGRGAQPEDFELFTFKAVSEAQQTVIAYNTAYALWYRDTHDGNADFDPAIFINLIGDRFLCNAKQANAVVLQVVFG